MFTKKHVRENSIILIEDDNDAVSYVKEIFINGIVNVIYNIEIINCNGDANCSLSNKIVKFNNVRNRISVLTSSIDPINSIVDRNGICEVFFNEYGKFTINVIVLAYSEKIKLTLLKVDK